MSPLRRARTSRSKTLAEVGREVGIDPGNLSRIERGEQMPSKEVLAAIVEYFTGEITEAHVLFPERFPAPEVTASPE